VGIKNGIHWKSTPQSYREDAGRENQRRTLLGEGSAPPTSDEGDPTTAGTMVPMAGKAKGTYETLNK
jgi:hypothetical protein